MLMRKDRKARKNAHTTHLHTKFSGSSYLSIQYKKTARPRCVFHILYKKNRPV